MLLKPDFASPRVLKAFYLHELSDVGAPTQMSHGEDPF